MAANNVETAFRLPSVIEGSYRTPYQEFIMAAPTSTTTTLYWSRQEKKSENSFQSMFTIQLSTSGAENSLDEEWFY